MILLLCAHPDDEVFGVGGTVAKYVNEGKKVVAVILSYGEMSMPWLQAEEVRKIRKQESGKAARILGCETQFIGLQEGKFEKASKHQRAKIISFIDKNPEKIFIHASDDPHIDHRAAYKLSASLLKEAKYKGEVYGFDVWNPLTLKNRSTPKLVVDITETFHKKLLAAKVFETQKIQGRWPLVPALTFRAFWYGFHNGYKYAERFRKL
tara:strand:- start:91 stop:714 length:624 start_codon:yes stop_codon:yes gene_type:complete